MPDLIVIGAGLTGLFASILAADKGAQVTLIAFGRGGLSLGIGCIDAQFPSARLSPVDGVPHPLSLAGADALRAGCTRLQSILAAQGLCYRGSLDRRLETLAPLGSRRRTHFAPEGMLIPPQLLDRRAAIAGIEGFRDFTAGLAARGWRGQGPAPRCLDDLPLPGDVPRRDLYATDLARWLEDEQHLAQLCEQWRPRLMGLDCLGLPAILGMMDHTRIKTFIETSLGLQVFEIPTLPPSVPGLRLETALRRAALAAGVTFIEGAWAIGQLDGDGAQRRAHAVVAETAGGPRVISAESILLASGGVTHGGLQTDHRGTVIEPAFGVPVAAGVPRAEWVGPGLRGPHAYSQFGVRVNERMQPLDAAGGVFAADLYAAGGLLAGADRVHSACRQGIDLATGYRAIEVMLA